MTAQNACEGILCNPQLKGAINSLVRSVYNRNRELMVNSSYDVDDLNQELMLELCEEAPRSEDSHYQRLCNLRLLDIVRKMARIMNDYTGERVSFASLDDDESGIAI